MLPGVHLTKRFIDVTDNTAEKSFIPLDGDVSISKGNFLGHILHNILELLFLRSNKATESLCANFFRRVCI